MKLLFAAVALAAVAVLPAACGSDSKSSKTDVAQGEAATAVTTPPAPAPSAAPASNGPAVHAGSAAAAGAPPFAVLYPGASVDAPAVTASGPAGPGGLVTFTTDAEPEAVIAFYRIQAEAAGLASTMAMNQGEARAYSASGADASANLQVVASPTDTGETSVQLSWSAGQ